jgi:hypothetical protein
MHAKRALSVVLTLTAIAGLQGTAVAQDDITIRIERDARLTADGGLVFRVHLRCGPLPGSEEFREAIAGAFQARTGAEAEGGLSPELVCDGTRRTSRAVLSPFTDEGFKRGPALASVSAIACNVVGDEQVCAQGSTQRRVVIAGPRLDQAR